MAQPIETAERAMRLAKVIVQEISLYNEDAIARGLADDNLFSILADEIERQRELYRGRVTPELYARTNYFDRALVDVLLKTKGMVPSKIW